MAHKESVIRPNKELRHEIRTFLVDCVCGKCGRGRLRPSGPVVENKTPHECLYCKAVYLVEGDPYPRTEITKHPVGPVGN